MNTLFGAGFPPCEHWDGVGVLLGQEGFSVGRSPPRVWHWGLQGSRTAAPQCGPGARAKLALSMGRSRPGVLCPSASWRDVYLT